MQKDYIIDSVRVQLIKKFINIILVGVVCILFILFYRFEECVLLETKYRKYWDEVGEKNLKEIKVVEQYKSVDDDMVPNIINNIEWIDGEINWISFTRNKNTLMLNGTAKENAWISITKTPIYLKKGSYYISSGVDSNDVYVYLEGWNDLDSKIIIESLGAGCFEIDTGDYKNGCNIMIGLSEGKKYDSVKITPRIIRIKNNYEISTIYGDSIEISCWRKLSNKEKRLELNRLKYWYPKSPWCSLFFDDGTGIQFLDGDYKEGQMNSFGYVYEND